MKSRESLALWRELIVRGMGPIVSKADLRRAVTADDLRASVSTYSLQVIAFADRFVDEYEARLASLEKREREVMEATTIHQAAQAIHDEASEPCADHTPTELFACDGTREGPQTPCQGPVVACMCSRCRREILPKERFYACADIGHRAVASERHERIRGRRLE